MKLIELMNQYDCQFRFVAKALIEVQNGTIQLKTRGLCNTRELISAFLKWKDRPMELLKYASLEDVIYITREVEFTPEEERLIEEKEQRKQEMYEAQIPWEELADESDWQNYLPQSNPIGTKLNLQVA
jgi:hypothetical protein